MLSEFGHFQVSQPDDPESKNIIISSTLGFKVADYVETTEFLSSIWVEYLEGKCSIRKVIAEYRKNGFQGNLKSYETYYRAVF